MFKFLSWIREKKNLALPSEEEQSLINQLKRAARQPFTNEGLEHSEAGKEWLHNLQNLSQEILQGDPRSFMVWRVIQNTMFVANSSYTAKELTFIKSRTDWKTRWKPAIRESPFGSPSRYARYPASSGNLIHHAYQIAVFESITRKAVDKIDLVLEFGGGYGSMCRLFNNLGYRGTYIIYDLPLFSALQSYYLKSIGLKFNNDVNGNMKVVCVSDFDQMKSLLGNSLKGNNLFLATWSISEVPLSVRTPFLEIARGFSYYLISFQEQFGEVNNLDYFSRYSQSMQDHIRWSFDAYEYLPGNHYLVGQAI